jgi:Mn2+/Fe2+ NRAMP family transporter
MINKNPLKEDFIKVLFINSKMAAKSKFKDFYSSIAPGFFMIGYVIGTGSVTTMAVSGARFGMSLTWALALSCLFTAFLMIAISRLTIVSGKTLIYNFRQHIHPGLGIFMIAALMVTAITSIMGVTAIVSSIFQEWTKPITEDQLGVDPLLSSAVMLGILYGLFWIGKNQTFLGFLTVMVGIMAICFILTMLIVIPGPAVIAEGLIPRIPEVGEPHMVIAGMVGTTMAGICLISRSTTVKEMGWQIKDLKTERRDSSLSMFLTFLISMAIIASAAGTLHLKGIPINNAREMLYTLEPLIGRFAVSVFAMGILSAGFSSIFPNMIILPWLLNDYRDKSESLRKPGFRMVVFLITLAGLTIPFFGGEPILLMILSQAVSPLIMPILVGALFYLMNSPKVMKGYKPGILLNAAVFMALLFSLAIGIISFQGFFELFQ